MNEAGDPVVAGKLTAAARRYLGGESGVLAQGFMRLAFTAQVREGGVPAAQALMDKALSSQDAIFRGAAMDAIADTGRADVATWLLGYQDPRLRLTERLDLVIGLAHTAETRDMASDWLLTNYDELAGAGANGVFFTSRLPSALRYQCSAAGAAKVERVLGPKVRALGAGVLDFERTVESIRHCGDLKAAREAEVATALKVQG